MTSPYDLGDDTPVYVISVAAQLAGMHPQTLRAYDRTGLVSPGRSAGGGRRYSLRDVVALREVQRLSQEEGVNLSGIKRILDLDRELRRHQQHLAEVTAELAQLRMELESTRAVAARLAGLLRSRPGGAQLVPVHGTGRAASPGGQQPPAAERRELPAAAGRAARADRQLNNDRISADPEN
ncbi:MAG TPA: helix-turn-helix transcriptional regulator [Streptosporangiaceae bacterium]|nr:helix-turn-helix transcriptional regulator [Streptosporangiaceae bacterium]